MSKSEFSKERIEIESFGGSGGLVTGSCHKLKIRDSQVMVDLGLFQGFEERSARGEQRNLGLKDSDFRGVGGVLLTHSHIDHCGRLPLAFKKGFRFDIYATEATASLAEKMLINSGEIQEDQPSNYRLYEKKDVDLTLKHLRAIEPFREFNIGQRFSYLKGEFLPNGHILGSASVLLRDEKNPNFCRNIFFSGDIGKPVQSLSGGYLDFADSYPEYPIHAMVLESTNYEKNPVSFSEKESQFMTHIESIWEGGGNVLLPTLSLHRSQEILEMLRNLQKSGRIPSDCRIIMDAPLAMSLTETYVNCGPDYFFPRYGNDQNFYKTEKDSLSRFEIENLEVIESHELSVATDKSMAYFPGKAIIIASGGMFGFGRSMNYKMGDFCRNPKNGVIFTCFQVEGTDGARLLFAEQNKDLKKDKNTHDKKGRLIGAKVFKVDGFTSHASGEEIIGFMERFNLEELKLIDIGHGKNSSRLKMAEDLKSRGYRANIVTPDIGEKIELYA